MSSPEAAPPRLVKGGLVLIDPTTAAVIRVIELQYNPESISRALQPEMTGGNTIGGRAEPLQFSGPPIETIQLELRFDASDRPESRDATAGSPGILPQLAALESAITPTTAQLEAANQLSAAGALETAPMPAPICVFVWGPRRVVPVRITAFNVLEEEFDPQLNPTRAKVSLGLRVLSVADVGFESLAGRLYLKYLRTREEAATHIQGTLATLGLGGLCDRQGSSV
jgi:hypothetical protein